MAERSRSTSGRRPMTTSPRSGRSSRRTATTARSSIADVVGPYLRHLIAAGGARVAVEDGAVVGFGATIDTGRGRSTSPTCSSGRTASARGSAGRCSTALFGDAGRGRRSPRTIRGRCRSTSGPGWRRSGPACTSRDRPAGCRPPTGGADDEPARPPTSWRSSSGRGPAHDRSVDHGLLGDAARRRPLRRPRWRRRSSPIGIRPGPAGGPVRVLDPARRPPRRRVDPVGPIFAALRRAGRGGEVLAAHPGPEPGPAAAARPRLPDRGPRPVHGKRAGPRRSGSPHPEPRDALRRRGLRAAHGQAGTSSATGFSIGTPTMLPHSVQLPS